MVDLSIDVTVTFTHLLEGNGYSIDIPHIIRPSAFGAQAFVRLLGSGHWLGTCGWDSMWATFFGKNLGENMWNEINPLVI